MNIVLHVIGMIAAALLTWCMFLPAVKFVGVVCFLCAATIVLTTIKQLCDWMDNR